MEMFDPVYVTEVLNDILSRRGKELFIKPKDAPPQKPKTDRQAGREMAQGAAERP